MTPDLTGQTFGRLTVLGYTGLKRNNNAVWQCRCKCGNIHEVCGNNLKNGTTQSCGCLHSEVSRRTARRRMPSAWKNFGRGGVDPDFD